MVVTSLFHTVNDVERVGDHAENLAELAELSLEEKVTFSDVAVEELKTMSGKCIACFEDAVRAREFDDTKLAKTVEPHEDIIDQMEEELRTSHIERLSQNSCNATAGVIFLDVISNLERISDHASNVALSVLDEHGMTPRERRKKKSGENYL